MRKYFGLFALMVTACGSSEPKSPADTPPPIDTPPPAASGMSGAAAPTNSDDVKKGIAALKANDLPSAKADFDAAIAKNPQQADAYHYRAVVEDQVGMKDAAVADYKKALELSPDLEESAVNLAALDIEGGKFDDAAALMKRAVAKDPKNPAIHVNYGMALSGKGDEAGADKELDEAVRLDPNNAVTLITYAQHLEKFGKKDQASQKLAAATGVAASDPGVLASIALEYKNMRDFKSCVATLDKAVAAKDVAELRIYRGTCKLGQRDLPGASADFKDAVTKEPNNAVAHYSLGNALADSGKLSDAITEWQTYLQLSPDGPMAAAAKKKIDIANKKKR